MGGEGATSVAGGLLVTEGPEVNALGLCHHRHIGHGPPHHTELEEQNVGGGVSQSDLMGKRGKRTTSVTPRLFNTRARAAAPSIGVEF